MKIIAVGIIPLFLIIGWVVGFAVHRAIKGGKGGVSAIVSVFCMLLGVLAIGAAFLGVVRVSVSSNSQNEVAPVQAPIPPLTPEEDNYLNALDDTVVTRDIYTSIPQLGAAVAAKVAAACDQLGPHSPRVVIANNVDPQLVSMVKQVVLHEDTNPLKESPSTQSAEKTTVTLSWQNRAVYQPSWSSKELMTGGLSARVRGPKGSWSVYLNFQQKPWLNDPPELPANGYRVMKSGSPAISRDAALDMLTVRTRQEIINEVVSTSRATMATTANQAFLGERVQLAIAQRSLEADRCVISIDGPTGRTWYATALVDARPQTLIRLAQDAATVSYERRTTWATLILSLGGMLLTLGVVYAGLNAMTRGYFQGRLIAGTAVAAVVLVAVIVLFLA